MDPPTQPPPDYELRIFSYRHTILATGPVETNRSDSVLFELHHWHPPMVRKLTSARLPLSTLSGLKDSVSLGTFSVQLMWISPEFSPDFLRVRHQTPIEI